MARLAAPALLIGVVVGIILGLVLAPASTVTTTVTATQRTTTTTTYTTTYMVTETHHVTTTITKGVIKQVCFSKTEACDMRIIQLIGTAKKSVYVAVYSFTRDGLANALVDASRRGLDVKVVIERDNAFGSGSEYLFLKNAGVDVRLDNNPDLMHHKFMIVDGEIVLTGSYNWSTAAEERNDENYVVIADSDVAALYTKEFFRVWSMAS
jgi:phosphatidylserine/phosphatidylglycerophosphate/cardiolipin synthase-like enzyme